MPTSRREVTQLLAAAALTATSTGAFAAKIPAKQKQYRLVRTGAQALVLKQSDAPVRQPGANEVLVKVHAASLNRRDVLIAKGLYPLANKESVVPLSDGAGEVVAVGSGVSRFKVGDRVAATFLQSWISGRISPETPGSALGGELDGLLTQFITLNEQGLVALPKHLTYEEGSTLPCAGLTAWNGLFGHGTPLREEDTVLLQGTGGVSIFGLLFVTAAKARALITSSSDEKLARARTLGAGETVNYQSTPEWEKPVRERSKGGVLQVLEVGGKATLPRSLASLTPGGHISLIGGLTGFDGTIPANALLPGSSVTKIYVGSRASFDAMNEFIELKQIRPVVDRVFPFKDAQAAFDLMESGAFFGKIVIRLS